MHHNKLHLIRSTLLSVLGYQVTVWKELYPNLVWALANSALDYKVLVSVTFLGVFVCLGYVVYFRIYYKSIRIGWSAFLIV